MPVVQVYRHGFTAACVSDHTRTPPVRTECHGWTRDALQRNKRFLYSVDERQLTGVGFAVTLTVRVCPATHDDWKKLRESFCARLRRLGMIRCHWLTEWQRRGVPHFHLAVWFPQEVVEPWGEHFGQHLISHWLAIANAPYQAQLKGQTVTPIWDVIGWNQYTSKHAARGLSHYQRSPENIPEGWRNVGTGRMWGKLGAWPIQEPSRVEMPYAAFCVLRRMTRSYRLADARLALSKASDAKQARTARRRISFARGSLRCPDPRLCAVRGLNEWLPERAQLQALAYLASCGFFLES